MYYVTYVLYNRGYYLFIFNRNRCDIAVKKFRFLKQHACYLFIAA